jgi:hypothetical protein
MHVADPGGGLSADENVRGSGAGDGAAMHGLIAYPRRRLPHMLLILIQLQPIQPFSLISPAGGAVKEKRGTLCLDLSRDEIYSCGVAKGKNTVSIRLLPSDNGGE